MKSAADTTHLFFAAYQPRADPSEEDRVNGAMLRNLVDALKSVRAPLARVVLVTGIKWYGVHLGPVPSPFYEDDPRHVPPNFYYTQEEILRADADAGAYEWTNLRPDVVVGDVVGNPMNIALVLGVFAAICRATNTPFRFPGTPRAYDVLTETTDSRSIARGGVWAATAPSARNEAFNLVGPPFRWHRLWPRLGRALALDVGPPMPLTLSKHMADKAPLWERLVREHRLREIPYEKLVSWPFGDFVFNIEFDLVADTGKIRRAGFIESMDAERSIVDAIARLKEQRYLP